MRTYVARAALLAWVLAPIALCVPTSVPAFVPGTQRYGADDAIAPLVHSAEQETIHDHYLIGLKPGVARNAFMVHHARIQDAQVSASNVQQLADHGIRHVYDLDAEVLGYAGRFSPDVLAYIRAQPEVAYVEADQTVRVTMLPQGNERVTEMPPRHAAAAHTNAAAHPATFPWEDPYTHLTEQGAPWGLARLSHRKGLTLGTFNKYVYEAAGGEGVTAYIIDTGVYTQHEDFEGRARWGKTIPENDLDADQHGHGTHCAGTIGSATYGVAKKAELVAVKVLGAGGSGSMADVTAGVLWAVADARNRSAEFAANPHSEAAKKHRGFVASMSLGGTKSPTLDRAVNGAVQAGMHFAVAAGNENDDACDVSPAGAQRPVTVGASTIADERAYFSNKGPCVDVFGPGLNVLSTWNQGTRALNTLSGTSMATPHIAGLMAYLLSVYGSEDFGEDTAAPRAATRRAAQGAWRTWAKQVLAAAYLWVPSALRPAWNAVLPAGRLSDKAAQGGSTIVNVLTPKALKHALLRMASKGQLEGLDPDTVNKLAFNNATTVPT